ncbi:MAG TPA: hypothetical protein VMV69_04600 [Pirellulales bacterium]|nr:hypothetical protein [Pirellulales bacterium]
MTPSPGISPSRWRLALTGQFLLVFSIVALSGPGRIDIADGLTRYEVARSLVEHGDSVIRDEAINFMVFDGRGGRHYTNYRFPQSLLGVGAIVAADLTGTVSEPRRYFFYSLLGAVACGALAVVYSVWFQSLGHAPRPALLWGCAGVVCTPNWFYGTTTFDDVFGGLAVVMAVVVARLSRHARPLLGAGVAGLLTGLAFNCKQPLGLFALVALAALREPGLCWRKSRGRIACLTAGVVAGVVAYLGYDWYKFPPGSMAANVKALESYLQPWPGEGVVALVTLVFSPGIGVLWYWPPVVIGVVGLKAWNRRDPGLCAAAVAASLIYFGFIATLSFFGGEPAWGPRYLTPAIGLLWLFLPAGAALMKRHMVVGLLMAGAIAQIMGLSVETLRLYLERPFVPGYMFEAPLLYFHPAASHLFQRPREIWEILHLDETRIEGYSPAARPSFPVTDHPDFQNRDMLVYRVLNSFRPWWISQRYLPRDERPVDLDRTFALLALLAVAGLVMSVAASARARARRPLDAPREVSAELEAALA